ncbi:MAG: hypothetical protein NTX50_29415 [Candidatus Sumerlaeota bacterium]|nr:hypothetical protein [Candidatus Sumerlaeota bacterium]
MSESRAFDARKKILAPLTVALMLGALFFRKEWCGALNDVAIVGWILDRLARHHLLAFFVTLGLASLLEFGVCKLLRLGKPEIGMTVFGWIVLVILVGAYYSLFGLTALFARLTRRAGFKPSSSGGDSYWIARKPESLTLRNMKKQ